MLATANAERAPFPQIGSAAQSVDPRPDLPASSELTDDSVATALRVTRTSHRLWPGNCGLFAIRLKHARLEHDGRAPGSASEIESCRLQRRAAEGRPSGEGVACMVERQGRCRTELCV